MPHCIEPNSTVSEIETFCVVRALTPDGRFGRLNQIVLPYLFGDNKHVFYRVLYRLVWSTKQALNTLRVALKILKVLEEGIQRRDYPVKAFYSALDIRSLHFTEAGEHLAAQDISAHFLHLPGTVPVPLIAEYR